MPANANALKWIRLAKIEYNPLNLVITKCAFPKSIRLPVNYKKWVVCIQIVWFDWRCNHRLAKGKIVIPEGILDCIDVAVAVNLNLLFQDLM